ncbi:hypothetical protein ACFL16_00005 [Patescibacteria group bacterium]
MKTDLFLFFGFLLAGALGMFFGWMSSREVKKLHSGERQDENTGHYVFSVVLTPICFLLATLFAMLVSSGHWQIVGLISGSALTVACCKKMTSWGR